MTSRVTLRLLTGVLVLTVVSLGIGLLESATLTADAPPILFTLEDVLFGVVTFVALAWSTGLARRFGLSPLGTAGMALGLGLALVLLSAVLVNLAFPRLAALVLTNRVEIASRIDARWMFNIVAQAMLFLLPFATWRAVQQHRAARECRVG